MIPTTSSTCTHGIHCFPFPTGPPRPSLKGRSICLSAPPPRPSTIPLRSIPTRPPALAPPRLADLTQKVTARAGLFGQLLVPPIPVVADGRGAHQHAGF